MILLIKFLSKMRITKYLNINYSISPQKNAILDISKFGQISNEGIQKECDLINLVGFKSKMKA